MWEVGYVHAVVNLAFVCRTPSVFVSESRSWLCVVDLGISERSEQEACTSQLRFQSTKLWAFLDGL